MAKVNYLLILTCCASLSGGIEPYYILDVKTHRLKGEKREYSIEEICVPSEDNRAPCVVLKTEEYEKLLIDNANLKFYIDTKGF